MGFHGKERSDTRGKFLHFISIDDASDAQYGGQTSGTRLRDAACSIVASASHASESAVVGI